MALYVLAPVGGSELRLKVALAPRTVKNRDIPFGETKLTLRCLLNASAYVEQSSPNSTTLRAASGFARITLEIVSRSFTERYYRLNVEEVRNASKHSRIGRASLRGNCFWGRGAKRGRRFRQHLYTLLFSLLSTCAHNDKATHAPEAASGMEQIQRWVNRRIEMLKSENQREKHSVALMYFVTYNHWINCISTLNVLIIYLTMR